MILTDAAWPWPPCDERALAVRAELRRHGLVTTVTPFELLRRVRAGEITDAPDSPTNQRGLLVLRAELAVGVPPERLTPVELCDCRAWRALARAARACNLVDGNRWQQSSPGPARHGRRGRRRNERDVDRP